MAEENKSPEVELDTDGVQDETVSIEQPIEETTAFDKKYVWIPNIKTPTKHLINPINLDPLIPKEDLSKTTNGRPNFWEGFPIQFEKK